MDKTAEKSKLGTFNEETEESHLQNHQRWEAGDIDQWRSTWPPSVWC